MKSGENVSPLLQVMSYEEYCQERNLIDISPFGVFAPNAPSVTLPAVELPPSITLLSRQSIEDVSRFIFAQSEVDDSLSKGHNQLLVQAQRELSETRADLGLALKSLAEERQKNASFLRKVEECREKHEPKLERLVEEKKQLTGRLRGFEEGLLKMEEAKAELNGVKDTLSAEQKLRAEVETKYAVLKADYEENRFVQRKHMILQRTTDEAVENYNVLKEKYDILKKERKKNTEQNEEAERGKAVLAKLQEKNGELQEENVRLTKKWEAAMAELEQFKREIKPTHGKCSKECVCSENTSKIKELEHRLSSITEENGRMKKKMENSAVKISKKESSGVKSERKAGSHSSRKPQKNLNCEFKNFLKSSRKNFDFLKPDSGEKDYRSFLPRHLSPPLRKAPRQVRTAVLERSHDSDELDAVQLNEIIENARLPTEGDPNSRVTKIFVNGRKVFDEKSSSLTKVMNSSPQKSLRTIVNHASPSLTSRESPRWSVRRPDEKTVLNDIYKSSNASNNYRTQKASTPRFDTVQRSPSDLLKNASPTPLIEKKYKLFDSKFNENPSFYK